MKFFALSMALVMVLPGQTPSPPTSQTTAPISVQQAIDEALAANLQLAAEKYNLTISEARQITARLRPNPLLTVSGQTLDLLGAPYNPDTPLGPNQVNVHTDFPIERGGKRRDRIELAGAERSLAELGVREVMRQVVYRVEASYVDVQQAKANLETAQQNLTYWNGIVDVNRARLNSGDLAQVELDRTEIAALQYRTAVDQAQLQLDQAKTQLKLVLGRTDRTATIDVDSAFRIDPVPASQEEVSRLAFERRPDFLADRQGQVRSQADLRLQLANGKVDYSIGAEYTHQQAWGIGGSSLGFYFSVPLPVFNRNQGEIARAEGEISQQEARVKALTADINADVEKAYREYQVSRSLLESIENNMLTKAKSVRDTTEYSYRRGEATLVEFLDAQRAFNEVLQTYNAARAGYARSLYQIDAVSGANLNSTP